tara:strand:- start:97 stop:237 length:141 start_codon:yes stop_codon:yes gene_type:complete
MEKKEIVEFLKDKLENNDTVYTNLKHVSKSGLTRDIQLMVIKDNEP